LELERISGKSLPTETLYQAASVEALAEVLRRDATSSELSSLVPLQTGGSRPPLFLVHTTPGDILGYGNLIYHLDPDQPCYGLQSAGLLRLEESHQSIEAMAAYYLGLIRSMEPKGPYYLAGWCYGGIVAVEMARQLAELGETVAFLGLLETVAPAPPLRIYRYYVHRLACFLRMKPAHWARYFRSKIRYYRESSMANRMRFRRLERIEAIDPAALEEQNRRLAQLEHVYSTNLAALKRYRARPYPGAVTLINAHEVDPGVIADPLYAWAGLAKEIRIYSVPGDHDTMLTEPNVAVLARTLEECLCAAQAAHRKTRPSNEPSRQELSGVQRL
jgi:thioesterase domain-containing protein